VQTNGYLFSKLLSTLFNKKLTLDCIKGHELAECTGAAKPIDNSEYVGEDNPTFGDETKYIFVRLSVLREYLRRDLVSLFSFSLMKAGQCFFY
jgi:hypothetical protein